MFLVLFELRLKSHKEVHWEDSGILGNPDDDIAAGMGEDEVFYRDAPAQPDKSVHIEVKKTFVPAKYARLNYSFCFRFLPQHLVAGADLPPGMVVFQGEEVFNSRSWRLPRGAGSATTK